MATPLPPVETVRDPDDAHGPRGGAPPLVGLASVVVPPAAPLVLVVAPPPATPVLDECQACGACCFSPQEHYVRLSGADHGRLTEAEQAAYTVFLGNRCFMRMEGGRCSALADVAGGFACQVYERRPQLCRDYELAGPACAVDRERRRLPVLAPPRP